MKFKLLALLTLVSSAHAGVVQGKYDSFQATNTVYSNILNKNISPECEKIMVAFSHRSELEEMEGLVGLDIGINGKIYNLGGFKALEEIPASGVINLYVYDSDYSNSVSILETLKNKKVIDDKLELEIQKTLNFQPRYKIEIDAASDQIKGIYLGYKYNNNFEKICGK